MLKDDLAQVEDVDMAQNQVTLKLIPRIDYSVKRGALKEPTIEVSKYFWLIIILINQDLG